jgi:hypothetical protein
MFAIVPALTLGLLLTGCSGKKGDDDDDGAPRTSKKSNRSKGGPTTASESLKPVKATEYTKLTGMVTWNGDLPNFDEMTKNLQAGMKNDTDYCLTGKTKEGKQGPHKIHDFETFQQVYRIGDNKGLGNVFIWIQPEKDHYFEVPADQLAKFKDSEVVISQPHCAFLPHVAVVFPSYYKDGKQAPTGQKFIIQNDAVVSHNSKVAGGPRNPGGNPTLGPGAKESFTLKPDSTPITVSCGIHTWMRAYVRAFDHPYATVTSVGGDIKAKKFEDPKSDKYGTYEITGVPVGAKVRILAWHPELGPLNGSSGEELTIQKGENKKDFTAAKK